MAGANMKSLTTKGRSIKLFLLSLVFVAAQIMVGYHHVAEEFGHAHSHDHAHAHPLAQALAQANALDHSHDHEHGGDHDDFAVACDICTISATLSGPHLFSFVPEAPKLNDLGLLALTGDVLVGAAARPGGPRAPPQTL